MSIWAILASTVGSLLLIWLILVAALAAARPKGGALPEALRLLPDLLRLLRNLATDPALPRGVRFRLALLVAYLAMPIDLIPDFIPVLGYADDVIIAIITLRSVARHAGLEAIKRHWTGTPDGFDALARVTGLREPRGSSIP